MTEEALFEQVYASYGPALYRFCLLQMKNPSDAEVFCRRCSSSGCIGHPSFQSAELERRWLISVALNQCRDEWKHRRRAELPLEAAAVLAMLEEDRRLVEQVAALPEKLRTVLHLHYYEGYRLEEIAALLGVTVSAVKMRMKRGREALRTRLEEEP